jgi:flavin-dependent dehydrogenase
MRTRFEALVLGGGPAGATAALLLARAGWSVAVVEKTAFPRRKVCGEFLSATNLPLLRDAGLADRFLEIAGPEIRRIAVFAGDQEVAADMPRLRDAEHGWGRAVGREHLDTMLLERAISMGASVFQPCIAIGVRAAGNGFECAVSGTTSHTLHARVLIAAHGSWDAGALPTQRSRRRPRPADLFGFKAHVLDSRLPPGLMPLLTFPGGYGGMVRTDNDRLSVSCCVRRDRLEQCRQASPGLSAGDAVARHITRYCQGARDALGGSRLDAHGWRSAGPIRPGVCGGRRGGIFMVGNAAGEAHPVVAEGISMALQSSWLLARHLIAGTPEQYAAGWASAFAWRIRAAAAIAHWAMRPGAVALTLPLLRAFPLVLTASARQAGKVTSVSRPHGMGVARD